MIAVRDKVWTRIGDGNIERVKVECHWSPDPSGIRAIRLRSGDRHLAWQAIPGANLSPAVSIDWTGDHPMPVVVEVFQNSGRNLDCTVSPTKL